MTKVIFNNKQHVFQQAIKTQAAKYFAKNGIKPTGNIKLYSKALILIFSAVAIYIFLLFSRYNAVIGILHSLQYHTKKIRVQWKVKCLLQHCTC